MSGRSDYGGSSAHLTSPLPSRPTSKAHSMDQDLLARTKPSNIAALNVLFLGETDVGERSVIDLVVGSVEQKMTSSGIASRALGDDVGSITLDSKKFTLHVLPANESMPVAARKEKLQDMLVFLRRNGGAHLFVYCMNALHPLKWIPETHHTIASNLSLSPRIRAVAVVIGSLDVSQQERWWSRTRDSLANQGPRFDDHTFIQIRPTDPQSLIQDHISRARLDLHGLILRNASSEMTPDSFQRTALYEQRSIGNSFQSLLVMLARKPPSHPPVGSKPADIVLLGEVGVGKSSLINSVARANVAGISSDTIGCTRIVSKYTIEEKGRIFHLYDTPGLVDPQMGDQSFFDPIDTIRQLIRSLGNGNGPDLVLFCVDNSKPTVSFKRNYRICYKFICGSKVPFVLGVTKLGGDQGADQWWNKYGAIVRKYGISRSRCIGLGCGKARTDPGTDTQMREHLLSFLASCVDRRNKVVSVRPSMERIVSLVRSKTSTLEKTLMKQCQLEEQTARGLANRLVFSKNKSANN